MTDQDNLRRGPFMLTTVEEPITKCWKCGYVDPWHVHRERKRSHGRRRPRHIIDTMTCPACGTTWKERIDLPPGTEHLKCGNS